MKRIRLVTYVLMVFMVSMVGAKEKEKKIRIEAVRFEGNATYSDKKLIKLFISRPSSFFHRTVYREPLLKDDLEALKAFYLQKGFLDMQISSWQVVADSARDAVSIDIRLEEGLSYTLEDVAFLGNTTFSDSMLLSVSRLKPGAVFREADIQAATMKLLQHYADFGYLDASIKPDVRIYRDVFRVLVDYEILEKQPYVIGTSLVQGYERTRPRTILRELAFKTGDVANYSKIIQSQRKIYLTGLFDRVFLRTRPSTIDSLHKDILVEVKEHAAGEFSASLGFGSEDKIRSKLELSHQNIQGAARKAGLTVHASFIRWGGEVSFSDPWFLGVPLQLDMNLLSEYLEEPGYRLYRSGGQLALGRSLSERSRLVMTYKRNWTRLKEVKTEEIPEKLKNNQNSLSLKFIYDSRDNLFNPTKGFYWECQQEFGGNFTVHLNRFYRTLMRVKVFQTLGNRIAFGSSLEMGWMTSASGIDGVPLHERFYTGGPNSIRGFRYQRVGPSDANHVPTGGMVECVWNVAEIRRSIYKNVGLALFLDAGNVWSSEDDVNDLKLRYSPGFGFRMDTVLGLARLDLGWNLDRRSYEPGMRVYFSMGQAF